MALLQAQGSSKHLLKPMVLDAVLSATNNVIWVEAADNEPVEIAGEVSGVFRRGNESLGCFSKTILMSYHRHYSHAPDRHHVRIHTTGTYKKRQGIKKGGAHSAPQAGMRWRACVLERGGFCCCRPFLYICMPSNPRCTRAFWTSWRSTLHTTVHQDDQTRWWLWVVVAGGVLVACVSGVLVVCQWNRHDTYHHVHSNGYAMHACAMRMHIHVHPPIHYNRNARYLTKSLCDWTHVCCVS